MIVRSKEPFYTIFFKVTFVHFSEKTKEHINAMNKCTTKFN